MVDIPLDESSDKFENMSDRHRRRYYGGATTALNLGSTSSASGSSSSSALDRLRSNLSPVSSYYRPILRTIDGVLPNKVSI